MSIQVWNLAKKNLKVSHLNYTEHVGANQTRRGKEDYETVLLIQKKRKKKLMYKKEMEENISI